MRFHEFILVVGTFMPVMKATLGAPVDVKILTGTGGLPGVTIGKRIVGWNGKLPQNVAKLKLCTDPKGKGYCGTMTIADDICISIPKGDLYKSISSVYPDKNLKCTLYKWRSCTGGIETDVAHPGVDNMRTQPYDVATGPFGEADNWDNVVSSYKCWAGK